MGTSWEYNRAWASINEETHPGKSETELKEVAAQEWLKLLNKMGQSGWELVSERTALGGLSSSGTFWVEFTGTLKRQGSPL
jgi:hypothetical protein